VHKHIFYRFKITNRKERSKNTADWEKSIKESKIHIYCSAIEEEAEEEEEEEMGRETRGR